MIKSRSLRLVDLANKFLLCERSLRLSDMAKIRILPLWSFAMGQEEEAKRCCECSAFLYACALANG